MRSFLTLLGLVFATALSAQNAKPAVPKGPEIQFLKTSHDFGRINEDINYAKCRFKFVNTGDQRLFITNVHTACGCTTPDWSRDSIDPGDTGYVDAKYETINRLGTFRKSISVYSNAKNSPFVHLDIIGDVFKEKPLVNGIEIPDYGQIYFEPATVDFKPLFDNATDTLYVRLVNGTPFTTTFNGAQLPHHMQLIGLPKSMEPGENVKLAVVVNSTMLKSYGFSALQIPVSTDNPVSPDIGLFVAYHRKQYFPQMNARQLTKAPKISFDKELHDFGPHVTGDVMNTNFVLTNKGKSELVLHEVYPECSCVKVDYPKKTLQPGESMTIKVTYDSIAKKGMSNQSVWIVSNDPTRDEMRIYVRTKLPEKDYHCPTCH